jgi:hypothetical protein
MIPGYSIEGAFGLVTAPNILTHEDWEDETNSLELMTYVQCVFIVANSMKFGSRYAHKR